MAQRTLVADFRYDLLDRIVEVTYPNEWSAVYSYQGAFFDHVCAKPPGQSACDPFDYYVGETAHDELGRVARTTMASVDVLRTYSPQTQLPASLQVTRGGTRLLDLAYTGYDEAGNLTRVDDRRPDKAVDGVDASATYTYTADRDRLFSHDLGGTTAYFAYDALGNLTGRSVASPNEQNQFPAANRPHRLDHYVRGGVTTSLDYDADGNVTRRGGDYFQYDSQSRLTCVGPALGSCSGALYRYAPLGDARTYQSTAAGERIYFGELFEWQTASSTSTMHILVDGRRVASVERATDHLRQAWLPPFWEPPVPWGGMRWGAVALLCLALLALAIRLEVPAQVARRPLPVAVSLAVSLALVPGHAWGSPPPPSGVVKRWYVEDPVGSATLVLDANGNVVDRKVFEPFGKVFRELPGHLSAERFTGKRFSGESKLYDFGARWYDPELGRFQQVDPIVQSPFAPVTLNAYAYAGNNPVRGSGARSRRSSRSRPSPSRSR